MFRSAGNTGAAASIAKPSEGGESRQQSANRIDSSGDNHSQPASATDRQTASPSEAGVANGQAQIEQPDPHKLRDLIAQEDMAYWAMGMFFAALATFLVTSIGTFLIWRQVKLTTQAVQDTGQATEAMLRANEIADSTAERQLRAYVGIEWVGVSKLVVGEIPSAEISAKNFGQTPADGLSVLSYMALADNAHKDHLTIPANNVLTPSSKPPGSSSRSYPKFIRAWTEGDAEAFSKGLLNVYVFGEVRYVDAFKKPRTSAFRVKHTKICKAGLTLNCERGNWAD